MPPPPQETAANRVESLRSYEPHPERTQSIRQWHASQIGAHDPSVAMIHIAISASGQIHCKGLGLDDLHSRLILAELDQARAKLAEYLNKHPVTNVIPLRP